ncbi:uncharacterized protein F5Z01DRAFT_641367 [Emericellopsis atlantica]|uniref:Uncharacterized protein n=1 Tax=Emericellopsis atlantica TaxID=2614577 RepID=A0A9P7ZWF0_9HYPO|nr:uncharacterized protein F5Z01DRAFT_641367 [Emericellopsis atlantica]KAG9258783.1 hypothetical protein F5Z01DRAFT_641367 [Emericellopsis atlantica]
MHSSFASLSALVGVALAAPKADILGRELLDIQSRGLVDFVQDFSVNWVPDDPELISGSFDDGEVTFAVTCNDCWVDAPVTVDISPGLVFLDTGATVTFGESQGRFDVTFSAEGGTTESVNLFTSHTPFGSEGDNYQVGAVLKVDLVFSVDAEVEVEGGFEFHIPDGSYMSFNSDEEIVGAKFDGFTVDSFLNPLQFDVNVTVALQVSLEVSLGIGFDDKLETGAGFGAFLNVPEVHGRAQSTEDCALEASVDWEIKAGAFAWAGFETGDDAEENDSSPGFEEGDDAMATTSVTAALGGQVVDPTCLYDAPDTTSILVSSAPLPVVTTRIAVSGAPPPDATTVVMVSGADPLTPSITMTPIMSTSVRHAATSSWAINNSTSPTTAPPAMHTTTVSTTKVHTVTKCAAQVIHCPAEWQQVIVVTEVVDLFTTVCPIGETPTFQTPEPTPVKTTHVLSNPNGHATYVPYAEPKNSTFTPPADLLPPAVHTVTLTQSVPLPTEDVASQTVVVEYVQETTSIASQAPNATSTPSVPELGSAATLQGSVAGAALASVLGLCLLWL